MYKVFTFGLLLIMLSSFGNSHNEEEVRIENIIPNTVTLDTTNIFDIKRNLNTLIILPRSNNEHLDKIVKEEINTQKERFIKELDENIKNDSEMVKSAINSEYFTEPISIYKDTKIISYCFLVYYYFGGSVHPMMSFYSLNYDIGTKSIIKFNDYFTLKTIQDSANLLVKLNKAINRNEVKVDSIYEFDFNIEKDTISFNFDDYEIASYAEGVIRCKISKKELNTLIKSTFH